MEDRGGAGDRPRTSGGRRLSGKRTIAIEARGLEFRYGASGFRLRLPELSIAAGEKVACIGPSGSGKSTLLNLAASILLPTAGSLRVDGTEWSVKSDAERRAFRSAHVGLVFQELELLEHLDVRENVLLPYLINSALTLDASVEARLADLVRAADIEAHLTRKPRALSQGERQRVAICRSLITSPGLLLADEPTGNLDPENSRRVVDLLTDEVERHSATLLLVTHDHALLERFDRVLDLAACGAGGAE